MEEKGKDPKALGMGPIGRVPLSGPDWPDGIGTAAGSPSLKVHGEGDGNTMELPTDPLVASYDLQGGSGLILIPRRGSPSTTGMNE